MGAPGAASDGATVSTTVRFFAHASGLHSVERELSALHRRRLAMSREDVRTVRLSTVTLVAQCADEQCAGLAEDTVELIYQSHPARAIVVVAEPGGPDNLAADMSLLCSDDTHGETCAEQVRLTIRGRSALHVTSAVAPLLLPDVPVYLWLVGDISLDHVFHHEAPALEARLIIDSGSYADIPVTLDAVATELEHDQPPALIDLAWARSRRWRERLALAFDASAARRFVTSVDRVEIESEGVEPSAQAWLTAGWIMSRLRGVASDPRVIVTSTPGESGSQRLGELTAIRMFARSTAHRAAVMLARSGSNLDTQINVDGGLAGRWTTPLDPPDMRRLLGGVLDEETRADPIYQEAARWGSRVAES